MTGVHLSASALLHCTREAAEREVEGLSVLHHVPQAVAGEDEEVVIDAPAAGGDQGLGGVPTGRGRLPPRTG